MFFLILALLGFSYGASIDEVMRLALEKSPRIKALEERVGVFEGLERSVSAFPNPEVRVESGFVTTDRDGKPRGRALYLVEFNQPLPLWGVREKGRRVVLKRKEAFESLVEAEKRKILATVYRSFFKALSLKEMVRIQEENYRTAEDVEKFVKKAFDMGEVTKLELLRARREKQLAYVRLKVLRSEYEASLKDLSQLVGADIESVEGKLTVPLTERKLDIESLPAVMSIKKEIEALNRRIELEKALAKPKLSAGFVVEDSEEGYYGFRGSVTLEVPVFYRRQGEILESIALRKSLKKELESRLLEVKNRLNAVALRLGTLKEEISRLDEEVLPQAREELSTAIKSYRLRTISLLELSDVRRRYYELLSERIRLLREAHLVYSELIAIGGWKW